MPLRRWARALLEDRHEPGIAAQRQRLEVELIYHHESSIGTPPSVTTSGSPARLRTDGPGIAGLCHLDVSHSWLSSFSTISYDKTMVSFVVRCDFS